MTTATKTPELTSFTTRDVPWGKVGATIDKGSITAAEAAVLGGLDFQVDLLEAGFRYPPTHRSPRGSSTWSTVEHRRAVVRRDTQEFFQFVSEDYTAVQYVDAFAFMDAINPRFVAAGALAGGRQAFMVVELPGKEQLNLTLAGKRDAHRLYVVLRTSHDMTRALEVCVMLLRGKCMNALTLRSFTSGAEQRWSVRHVGQDPMAKLDSARMMLAHTKAYVDDFTTTAKRLAAIDLELDEANEILRRVLPDKPRRDQQINGILAAWQNDLTNGHPTNGWGLVNGVSEYFEWGRSDGLRTNESRFTSGLTGPTNKYQNRTAQLLLVRR